MEEINKHIKRVNFTAYFVMGWSFFMIFMIPVVSSRLNIPIDKTRLLLSIAEMLLVFVLSIGVTAKRYALLWPILIIILIETIGVSIILGFSGPLAILFKIIAIGLIINGIRSATLLKDLSNFYEKDIPHSFAHSETEHKTFNYKPKENLREKVRADFDSDKNYFLYILNVNDNSSPEEIKRAYKNAIKANHPDKFEHLGEEFKNIAETKTKIINEAMQYFRKEYNFN